MTAPTRLYGSDAPPEKQRRALTGGQIPVAVHGLGKMGLPLAAVYADLTGNVVGVDIDSDVVDAVTRGDCPVDNEPGLPEAVRAAVDRGALRATTESQAAADAATLHVVVVPTLVEDGVPDISALSAAVEAIGSGLAVGDVVVVESTVPPGTCRETVEPLLVAESGLEPADFGLAFCPERTASGRALQDIRSSYPKVVGGADPESRRVAELVYGEVTCNEVIPVADCTTAECVKVFEGVYRDVNIALANELARLAPDLGVDVREAIAVANTQPYCEIHDPGPGVGGHCIPYYPYFLIEKTGVGTPLLERARRVNDGMARVTVDRLGDELATRGKSLGESAVLLLGVTYRSGVDETRASPAIAVADHLQAAGADVYAADPVCSDMSVVDAVSVRVDSVPTLDPDAAVLLTDHDAFRALPWGDCTDVLVFDTRGALDGAGPHRLVTLGDGTATPSETL